MAGVVFGCVYCEYVSDSLDLRVQGELAVATLRAGVAAPDVVGCTSSA